MNKAIFFDESKQAGTYENYKIQLEAQGIDIDDLIRRGIIAQNRNDIEDTLFDEVCDKWYGDDSTLNNYFDFDQYYEDRLETSHVITIDDEEYYYL